MKERRNYEELGYSEKQLEIKAMLRDFAEREIAPILNKMDRDAEYPLETVKKLGKMGIMGMLFPEGIRRQRSRLCHICHGSGRDIKDLPVSRCHSSDA